MTTDKQELLELLPCPFCGSKSVLDFYPGEGDHTVTCQNMDSCNARMSNYGHKMHVINAWNRRKETRPAKAEDNKGKGDAFMNMDGHDEPCAKCGTKCNALSGNFAVIPICLWMDGEFTTHCAKCVIDALSSPAPCVDVEQLKRDTYEAIRDNSHKGTHYSSMCLAIDHLHASGHLSAPQVSVPEIEHIYTKDLSDEDFQAIMDAEIPVSREKELMATIADAALSILTGANGSILDTVWYSDCETLYDFLRFSLPDPEGDWSNDPETQAEQLRDIIAQAQKGGERE